MGITAFKSIHINRRSLQTGAGGGGGQEKREIILGKWAHFWLSFLPFKIIYIIFLAPGLIYT